MTGLIAEESERLQEAVAEVDRGSRHLQGKTKLTIYYFDIKP